MISRVVRSSFPRAATWLAGFVAMTAGALLAQEVPVPGRVSGTVTSAEEGGQAIYGVNVIVKGTTTGTITASNGRYTIVAQPNDTLVFRFIGYAPQEVPVAGRAIVNVAMQPQAVALQNIVVIGYGTQQRRDVTGAVATVSAEDITQIATPSVAQALQGKVAGVQVTPQSGEPGAAAVIRIRGVGTLNNASPLFVVDGMLLDDIDFLSPNDIQSVEVLKDASATAIYGSRGANGVIIVTTKKGVIEGTARFMINAYAGTQRVLDPIDLVSAREYAMLANELAANQGIPDYFPDENAVGAGTDWQDEIFDTAPIQSYQLSSSGGTDRIRYYFSGNYFRQAGVIPKSDFDRLTVRLNNDYQLTERLQLGHNLNFSYTDGLRPPGVLGMLYRADPTIPARNPDGTFANANLRSSAGNPAAQVFYTHNNEQARRLVGNVFGDLNVLGSFTLRTSFGVDYNVSEFREFVPVFVVSPTQQNVESDLNVRNDQTRSWLWENTVNWNWATDEHRVNALGGITWQSFYSEGLGGGRTNVVGEDPSLWYLNAGDAAGQTNFNTAEDWRMLSYLFRTNYAFRDRYLLTASLRVDGSSRFGSENRYGYFPSFAVGWNIAEEPFFPQTELVDALKLRVSWGRIGNDKIGAYPGVPVVSSNLNAVFGTSQELAFGASPFELANPEVKWETTTQTNIGADLAFFGGRLEATLDYYNRLTDGILVRVPIPLYVGVGTEPFVNAAEVENKGIEGSFTWAETRGKFRYEFNVNGSTINNKVKKLAQGREQILGGGLGNEITFTTRTVVGQPIGSFWGFKVAGVFQDAADTASSPKRGNEAPGDLKYADLNGDGRITDADKTFIGSPIPDLIYGLSTRVSWGGFDLAASFSGQSGNEVFNGKKAVRFGVENFETSYLDRWTGPGTSNREPRVTNAGHNYQASERFIEDGSFFKLNAVQAGYRLPSSLTGRLNLQTARIYVNGTNLFTSTDYTGYTPELTVEDVIRSGIDLGIFPPARTITLGLDLGF
ncbi:MAG TPA: TonB-dependent receptor [Gemmatimonadaceae bacterium]|nr:TonB-dependent receptor [Gemmatimonadaceae bacterium]